MEDKNLNLKTNEKLKNKKRIFILVLSVSLLINATTLSAMNKKSNTIKEQSNTITALQSKEQSEKEKNIAVIEAQVEVIIDFATKINNKTKEVFLIANKLDSGEINSYDALYLELSKIDKGVRDIVLFGEQIKRDRTSNEFNKTIEVLNTSAVELDKILIDSMSNVKNKDFDTLKENISKVREIESSTSTVIDKINELRT